MIIIKYISNSYQSRGHHNHRSQVQKELCQIEGKNPFHHVGKIELKKSHKLFGEAGQVLEAKNFNREMTQFISNCLAQQEKQPRGFDDVDDIKSCIKTTKSGITLGQLLCIIHIQF